VKGKPYISIRLASKSNNSVQATAAARFRFLALVVFIRSFCRARSLSAAVPDLWRWALYALV